MFIKYKNLVIRNADKHDSHILAKWWNDGTVMAHAGFPNGLGTTSEEIEQKIDFPWVTGKSFLIQILTIREHSTFMKSLVFGK